MPHGVVLADGRAVCLVRVGETVYALADQCSHEAMPLSAGYVAPQQPGGAEPEIECAWHGARFRCATGEPTRGPALDPVATYEVHVDEGRIVIGAKRPPA